MKNITKLNFSVNYPATQRLTLGNSIWINIILEDWVLQACAKHIILLFSLHTRILVSDCVPSNYLLL